MQRSADPDAISLDRSACRRLNDTEFFFPERALVPGTESSAADAFMRGWLSRALERLGEPSLSCSTRIADTYRLLLLPTWAPAVAVRITLERRRPVVVAKELDGQAGYDLGSLAVRASRSLFAAERQRLAEAISAAEFWVTPTIDYDRIVYDGTVWILEGRSGSKYHVVHRSSPEAGAFRDLCMLVMKLAGVRPIL